METWAKHLVSPNVLWITLSLISWALCQGEKSCRSWQHWVCVTEGFYACAWLHTVCILDFLLSALSCAFCTIDCVFLGACVHSVWLESSGNYVYSMCFYNYKGIFHSVMLIILISKSRNMKQEFKKQTSTVAGCAPAYFQPIFFLLSFFLYPTVKRFNWGWLCRPICQGF